MPESKSNWPAAPFLGEATLRRMCTSHSYCKGQHLVLGTCIRNSLPPNRPGTGMFQRRMYHRCKRLRTRDHTLRLHERQHLAALTSESRKPVCFAACCRISSQLLPCSEWQTASSARGSYLLLNSVNAPVLPSALKFTTQLSIRECLADQIIECFV